MGIDFTEFNKFKKQFDKATGEFDNFLEIFLVQMAREALEYAVNNTPVVTGNLRERWGLGDVTGAGTKMEIEILNGASYATDVEYGHRLVRGGKEIGYVDGRFMITKGINMVQQEMPKAYDIELKEFLKKYGVTDE